VVTRTEFVPFIAKGLVEFVAQYEAQGWAVRQIIEAGSFGFVVVFEREFERLVTKDIEEPPGYGFEDADDFVKAAEPEPLLEERFSKADILNGISRLRPTTCSLGDEFFDGYDRALTDIEEWLDHA
jgi:hypothetical protein